MKYEKEKKIAIHAVSEAAILLKKLQSDLIYDTSIDKEDRSPVTIADYGVQAIIISELNKSFPNDLVIGEEDSSLLRTDKNTEVKNKIVDFVRQIKPEMTGDRILNLIDKGDYSGNRLGRQWVLDPVDGTKGFLRGDQYAVALALIEDAEVVLGILGCPNLPKNLSELDLDPGQLYYAVRGEGAYAKYAFSGPSEKIHVDDIDDASQSTFCESLEPGHSSHELSSLIANKLGVYKTPVRIDSQCKYAVVSRGEASIYLRLPIKPGYVEKTWDHAAGSIITEEAGGKVTDIYGDKLDFSIGRTLKRNKGIIVTNGIIHEEVLSKVKEVLDLKSKEAKKRRD